MHMNDLARQRCFNHAGREAAARCPACRRCFCRECVTEHEDRLVCASCLRAGNPQDQRKRRRLAPLFRVALGAASFLALWFLFFLLGRAMLTLPSMFHEDIETVGRTFTP
jgi:hypothetical protein